VFTLFTVLTITYTIYRISSRLSSKNRGYSKESLYVHLCAFSCICASHLDKVIRIGIKRGPVLMTRTCACVLLSQLHISCLDSFSYLEVLFRLFHVVSADRVRLFELSKPSPNVLRNPTRVGRGSSALALHQLFTSFA